MTSETLLLCAVLKLSLKQIELICWKLWSGYYLSLKISLSYIYFFKRCDMYFILDFLSLRNSYFIITVNKDTALEAT